MLSPLTLLRLLVISLPLTLSPSTNAVEIIASKYNFESQKEILQLKIDNSKELLQSEIDAQSKQIDSINKRIDDQSNRIADIGTAIDRFSTITGIFGILITVLLATGGFIGYFSVVARVRHDAQEAANNWLHENEKHLRSETETMHSTAQETIKLSEQLASKARDVIERAQREIENIQANSMTAPEIDKDIETLQRHSEELKNIPENSYTFDDWNARAFAAYKTNQLDKAAIFWENAAQLPSIEIEKIGSALFYQSAALRKSKKPEAAIEILDKLISLLRNNRTPHIRQLVAKAMLLKGIVFGEIKQTKAAITTFDELIDFYKDDSSSSIQELVAMALLNKGIEFLQSNQNEKTIQINNELIANYASYEIPALRDTVTSAMLNKGFALSRLDQHDAAIAVFDTLIARCTDDSDHYLSYLCASAMYTKGYLLGLMQQLEYALSTFDTLISRYSNNNSSNVQEIVADSHKTSGINRIIMAKKTWENHELAYNFLSQAESDLFNAINKKPKHYNTLGDLAYAQWLLGKPTEAEKNLRTALLASKDGGEIIYTATIANTNQYPIPENDGFRLLLARVWSECQLARINHH